MRKNWKYALGTMLSLAHLKIIMLIVDIFHLHRKMTNSTPDQDTDGHINFS
jgi:hypothetical protein